MPKPITPIRPRAWPTLLTALAAASLVACNDSEDPPPAPTLLSGTAAIGAPMAGAAVVVSDADAATPDTTPVTADASGRYTVDVSALRAPLFVRASATIDGEPVQHVAVVPSVTASGSNTANVTPLTTAVATLIAPGGNTAGLATAATLLSAAGATQVGNATQLVVNTLRSDPGIAGLLGAGFDPLATSFSANGTGIDAALHQLQVSTSGGSVSISNLAAPAGDIGAPAAVTLTPAQVATPSSAPTLPPSATAGNTPTPAEMAALGAKLQACFALPPSQRLTTDSAGNVTAVLGACNFTPANWRSNGRSFAEEVGQFTLTKPWITGTRVGNATIVLALNPEGHTDPLVFQHPYCNSGPCVVVRFATVSASGRPGGSDWVLGKVNGAWDFVGNQRPYRTFVEARLNRKVNLNTAGAAAGNTADPYFFKDRHESVLRLIFDLSVGNTADVRAARFSGPGLPAAGVVMVRSQRCGTDDRLAITNQIGTTRVIGGTSNGQLQYWTGGSAAEFVLAAANLDGTALATPAPVNTATSAAFQDFSPTPGADVAAVVPSWSRFKVELFRFSTLSDQPDEVIYVRIGNGPERPSTGPTVSWPQIDAAQAAARATPSGALSASITGFADTVNWSIAAGSYVTSGYLFGQNFATATNAQNETASYALRGRLDYDVAAFGDSSAAGWRLASPVAGTALSSFTQNSGSNPNPRCGSAEVPALSSNPADYRELALFTRGPDRQLRQAIWFWDN